MPQDRADDVTARALQLDEALAFQRLSWRLQRLSWWMMAAIVVAAAAGFAGDGPAAHAVASRDGVLAVEYPRFARRGAIQTLEIRVAPTRLNGERLELFIDRDYIGDLHIHAITPPPERVVVLADAILYSFAAANAGLDLHVAFHVEPRRAGRHRARMWLPQTAAGDAAIGFEQFVWI